MNYRRPEECAQGAPENLEKFQAMIAEYNAGSKNVEMIFDELLTFAKKLSEEEKGSVA